MPYLSLLCLCLHASFDVTVFSVCSSIAGLCFVVEEFNILLPSDFLYLLGNAECVLAVKKNDMVWLSSLGI